MTESTKTTHGVKKLMLPSLTKVTKPSPAFSQPKPNDTLVYALGGLNEVGKNMYVIEHDEEIIIIDSGVMFPDESLWGVDYVIPDFSHLIKNQHKIKALIITHGHEDHIGSIPFLMQVVKLPRIYAPRFAKALINKKLEERKLHKQVEIEVIKIGRASCRVRV